uniref:Protein transport protein Sec24A n=1 Tax=Rhabditophanes sp. KR3021 TaxID=114890 RepID=A0AC35TG85_9BILA
MNAVPLMPPPMPLNSGSMQGNSLTFNPNAPPIRRDQPSMVNGMPYLQNFNAQHQTMPPWNHQPNLPLPPGNLNCSADGETVFNLINTENIWKTGVDAYISKPIPNLISKPTPLEPNIMESTLRIVPASKKLLEKTRLPFGLSISPFKDMCTLNTLESSIIRCRFCRTYLNPYIKMDGRNKWKCNICLRSNPIPNIRENGYDEYRQESLDNFMDRPEVKYATFEYIAPREYCHRKFVGSGMAFVFDVTGAGKKEDYLGIVCRLLSNHFQRMKIELKSNFLVTFLVVDEFIHLFQFDERSNMPKELVIDGGEEPFIPSPSGFTVRLDVFEKQILSFLEILPEMFAGNRSSQNCLGSALDLTRQLLEGVGGRVTIFQTSLPTIGKGAVENCQQLQKEETHWRAQSEFFKELALTCTDIQIGFDLFVIGSCFMDLGTIMSLPRYSSGQFYQYNQLNAGSNDNNLEGDFKRYLDRRLGLDGLLRIRCTTGLGIDTFYCNSFVKTPDSISMPIVSPDLGFAVKMHMEEDLVDLSCVSIQVALLYTSTTGQRKIRVHTMALPVSNDPMEVIKGFDITPAVVLLANMSADCLIKGDSLDNCRSALVNAATDGIAAYTALSKNRRSGTLLVMNSGIKLLPLYVFGLLKQACFEDSGKPHFSFPDIGLSQYLTTCSRELILAQVVPILKRIGDVIKAGKDVLNMSMSGVMESRLQLNHNILNPFEIFFLDAGLQYYLIVGENVEGWVLREFFNVDRIGQVQDCIPYKEINTEKSKLLGDYVHNLNKRREKFNHLVVVKSNATNMHRILSRYLIESKATGLNYDSFLKAMCDKINK